MWRDLRYGFRRFAYQKLFSVTVILLLGLGIGANTVIFSLFNSLLLKSMPVRHAENLYLFQQVRPRQVRPDTSFFYRQYEVIAREKKLFTGAVAEQGWAGNSFQTLSLGNSVQLVSTQIVSPNYFSELGVKARLGRVLNNADAAVGGETPVVMSEQCWRRCFLGDGHVLNRVIRIRQLPFRVVGVLPAGFHGIDADRVPDFRLPISAAPLLTGYSVTEPGGDYPIQFQILGRLQREVSAARAASSMTPSLTGMEDSLWRGWYGRSSKPFPAVQLPEEISYWRSYRVSLTPAGRGVSRLREQFSEAIILLMAGVALMLLVVCANVAGLFLVKAEERNHEIGIRLSLGASRWQLVRQLYAETLWLVIPGAATGVLFAWLMLPSLLHFMPSLGIGAYAPPVTLDVTPDPRVAAFVSLAALFAMAWFGSMTVRRARRRDLNRQMAVGNRSVSSASANGVVSFQIALTMVLVTASLLLLKTFWKLSRLDPGFDQNHVIEAVVDPWDAGFSESQATALLVNVRQRAAQIPGVRAVGFAGSELMRGIGTKTTVAPAGSQLPKQTFLNTSLNRVTPEYFESLGIPLLAGRNITLQDVGVKPTRIVVNRAFADYFFEGRNPVGRFMVQGVDGTKPATAVIVGVVGTAKYRSMREIDPPTYYSASDMAHAGGVIYVRTHGDAAPLIRAVQGIFRDLAPTLPIASIYTLRQQVEASLWQEQLISLLCMFFGISSLLLSAVGVYSALAYSVGRRLREIGIRRALGAQAIDIVRAVSARLAISIGLGSVAGLGLSVLLLRVTKSLLFGVEPLDVPSFAAAAVILLVCSVAAAAIPSWRAVKVEPAIALRQQ